MSVLAVLQDPRGEGGTATAVGFYRTWMDRHRPDERRELFLDELDRGGARRLRAWRPGEQPVPRVLPALQVPPYWAARRAVRRADLAREEIHVVGASAIHGHLTSESGPTLVWLATTLADERTPTVLRGRHWTRRIAYRATQPLLTRIEARVLLDAERVLAMSAHTAEVVVDLGVPAARVEVVMVPVDTATFAPPADDSARRGAAFVGRARDPRKGFDRLAAALDRSPRLRRAGVSAVSPGDPPDLPAGVRWLGRVEHLAEVYRTAEVLLLPSRQEGLGIVALEAMACGTPVVARRCGGIDAILAESGGGVTATTGDGFADAVEVVLADPDQARSMGQSGRCWVEANASHSVLLDDPRLFRV